MSLIGTFATCRLRRAMSVLRGTPEDICSGGVLLTLVESRRGAVALGRTYLLPPLSSGGALVVQPWLRFHVPLIEPDRPISRIRLSDKTSRLRFRVQRLLQFLNTRGVDSCPISRSFTTYCVCLELRSLPSTGITRLQVLRTFPPPQGARPVPHGLHDCSGCFRLERLPGGTCTH